MSQETLTKVTQMALELEPNEQLVLVEGLARSLRRHKQRRPRKSLFGIYKDKLPDDIDLDAMLREIRSEWFKELDEL